MDGMTFTLDHKRNSLSFAAIVRHALSSKDSTYRDLLRLYDEAYGHVLTASAAQRRADFFRTIMQWRGDDAAKLSCQDFKQIMDLLGLTITLQLTDTQIASPAKSVSSPPVDQIWSSFSPPSYAFGPSQTPDVVFDRNGTDSRLIEDYQGLTGTLYADQSDDGMSRYLYLVIDVKDQAGSLLRTQLCRFGVSQSTAPFDKWHPAVGMERERIAIVQSLTTNVFMSTRHSPGPFPAATVFHHELSNLVMSWVPSDIRAAVLRVEVTPSRVFMPPVTDTSAFRVVGFVPAPILSSETRP